MNRTVEKEIITLKLSLQFFSPVTSGHAQRSPILVVLVPQRRRQNDKWPKKAGKVADPALWKTGV